MPRSKKSVTKSFTFEGKRHFVTGKDKAEAAVKAAMMERDFKEKKAIVSGNMSVREWADKAVETYKTNQADITKEKYVHRMNHCILEQIGDMPLKQVKPLHCQDVLNMQQGKSKYQISQVYQMLNFIFRKAVENNLILENPAAYLTKPSGTKTTRRSITENERVHILKICDTDKRFYLFLLMLFCGCRPSEASEAKGLDIQKMENENVLHIRGIKTESADRYVPIPDYLYDRIKSTPKFSYITMPESKNKYAKKNYYRLCHRFYRELNLSMGCKTYRNELIPPYPLADDFVPYCLRHTYCTDLQKKGIDIRTAQYLMGHADIKMTANIYTHADNSTVIDAARILRGTTPGTTLDTAKTP